MALGHTHCLLQHRVVAFCSLFLISDLDEEKNLGLNLKINELAPANWAVIVMCRLFLLKKHHLLINIFLITAAAGTASLFSAKVTRTKHEIMWHEIGTLPGAKWPVTLPQYEEMMSAILQINLAPLLLKRWKTINSLPAMHLCHC